MALAALNDVVTSASDTADRFHETRAQAFFEHDDEIQRPLATHAGDLFYAALEIRWR